MYEITTLDNNLDPFLISRRPLHILNCNAPSQFAHANTRVTQPQAIYENLSQYFQIINGYAVQPPLTQLPDQVVSPNNDEQVYSDHLNRSFAPFTLPQPISQPFIGHPPEDKRLPHWMCDIPSSNMRPEEKIYFAEANQPKLTKSLPKCDVCGKDLQYPFFASLNYNLCEPCLHVGSLPLLTNSMEFFKVEDPIRSTGSWTIKETNKLLTLVEDKGDDWQGISQEIKTHTPAECLLHFMRLPMYDSYYVADPLEVPAGQIPNEPHDILPFMVAPDPIAAFVEFLHTLNRKLGNKIADISQKQIESILSSKSGMMLFNHIPSILKSLLVSTAEEAGKIAQEEFSLMMTTFNGIVKMLEKEVNGQHHLFEAGLKESQSLASKITYIGQITEEEKSNEIDDDENEDDNDEEIA